MCVRAGGRPASPPTCKLAACPQLTLASYAPHPGRYGNGPALVAAEQVFASDTRAAIAQIAMAEAAGIPAQPWPPRPLPTWQ
jgi:hypothetical protein